MIKASIPYQAELIFSENEVRISGSRILADKVQNLIRLYGKSPTNWQIQPVQTGEDVLLNEFILKCQNKPSTSYQHEELCHCRMIPAEKVLNAVKQGVFSAREISRVTLAGTGCGSCKKDIEELLSFHVK